MAFRRLLRLLRQSRALHGLKPELCRRVGTKLSMRQEVVLVTMDEHVYDFNSYGVIENGAVGSKFLPARGLRLSVTMVIHGLKVSSNQRKQWRCSSPDEA